MVTVSERSRGCSRGHGRIPFTTRKQGTGVRANAEDRHLWQGRNRQVDHHAEHGGRDGVFSRQEGVHPRLRPQGRLDPPDPWRQAAGNPDGYLARRARKRSPTTRSIKVGFRRHPLRRVGRPRAGSGLCRPRSHHRHQPDGSNSARTLPNSISSSSTCWATWSAAVSRCPSATARPRKSTSLLPAK